MKTNFSLLTLVCLIAFVFGCGSKKQPETNNQTSTNSGSKTTATTNSNQPDSVVYYKSVNDCKKEDSCTYIEIVIQKLKTGEQKDAINKAVLDSMCVLNWTSEGTPPLDINKIMDTYVNNYVSFVKENDSLSTERYVFTWFQESDARIELQNNNIAVFSLYNFNFLGGAHPNTVTNFMNFDMKTGKVLSLNDIFKPGFESTLNELIVSQFRKDKNLKPNAPLTDAGLFENKLTYNNNFAFTKDGFMFYYNNYEIAPYVMGPQVITISYSDISSLLQNPDIAK
ncbi:MAG TPA: DUF3298 domain-containing protein [Ignavibacteria bacterium]|nr:DUF3298 domain-containing protein [Ignavibacteria bacterium]